MQAERWMTILLAATVFVGCSRLTVTTKYDKSVNFAPLHTYAWRPGAQPGTGDPRIDDIALDKLMRSAIERILGSKGYHLAAEGTKPDFFVAYFVAIGQQTNVQTINRWYGYESGGGWGGWSQSPTYEYDEGTLLIDVVDATNSKLLWRGTGVGIVDPSATPSTREKRINAAVAQMLGKFPPK